MQGSKDNRTSATRREFLWGIGAVAAGGFLASCGGGGEGGEGAGTLPSAAPAPGSGTSAPVNAAIKQGGTLIVGTGGASPQTSPDPFGIYGLNAADRSLPNNLFDTLGQMDQTSMELELFLAEEISASQPGSLDSWDIRLRDGVEFHDGKTLSADDLIWTMQQHFLDTFAGAPVLSIVDIDNVKKLDARTVRVPLLAPFSQFKHRLCVHHFYVVHSGYDDKKPVGTGPFKFVSGDPGKQWVLERNPNYWGSVPHLEQIIIEEFTDESARTNALRSGQLHALVGIPGAQQRVLEQAQGITIIQSESGLNLVMTMNTQVAPFDDPRVREAMRLIPDRQQLVDQALGGKGVVANDLYSRWDPVYNAGIPQRGQDLERAKMLLKEAGQEDYEFELVTTQLHGGTNEACEVYVQQANDAGIKMTYREVDMTAFLANYKSWPFAVSIYGYEPFLIAAAEMSHPASNYNEPNFNDPEWLKLYDEASVETDPDKFEQIVHQMQQIEWERGGYIIWGWPDTSDAFSDEVVGFYEDRTGLGLNRQRYNEVGFKA